LKSKRKIVKGVRKMGVGKVEEVIFFEEELG